jgi:hypothetical protein
MDGVEYIDSVISVIKSVFQEDFDVRIDEDVFVPGETIRQNLERELTNADVVLALLDGLRPNVVYELGFAYGQRRGTGGEESPEIVCLMDRNATVLVRNHYPEAKAVPTITGEDVTVLNPPLDLAGSFSDNADLLVLTYDRLDLESTLKIPLRRWHSRLQSEESKTGAASASMPEEGPSEEESPALDDLWEHYTNGQYESVVEGISSPSSYEERKVFALSLMKLGKIYEAMQMWRQMAIEGEREVSPGTHLHLGICHYVIKEYEMAAYHFQRAKNLGDDRADEWCDRTRRKMAESSSSASSACSMSCGASAFSSTSERGQSDTEEEGSA